MRRARGGQRRHRLREHGMGRRAFTLIEVIIALALVVFGFFTFFAVFSTASHHAAQDRNRTLATMLAQSYLAEVQAHPYGAPAPRSWTRNSDTPAHLWIKGRQQRIVFHKKFQYANGSFVGKTSDQSDVVTITISWREGVGDKQTATGTQDNKQLIVQVPVWRGQ